MEETKVVTGVEEFKAVTHQLRVRLLAHLRSHGPATATELAKQFETDTGSTSYHLRKLAQFGFVTEVADPGGHPRSRRWAARHKTTSWSNADFARTPEGHEVSGVMRRRQLEVLTRDAAEFERQLPELPREWAEAAGMSGDMIYSLTAASLKRLHLLFHKELEAAAARDADDPDARAIATYFAGYLR